MITLYGSAPTRSTRVAWMLAELGLEYELIHAFDPRAADYLALNPNGKVPTLVDDDFVVWESMAVNLYLAEKYGGGLWPESLEDQTRARMWSFWAMSELEGPLLQTIRARRTDPAAAEAAEAELQRPLAVLEGHLADREHVLGRDFTVADLNVAAIVGLGRFSRCDFSPYPQVDAWESRCRKRPAFEQVGKLPMSPPPPPSG